MKSDKSVAGIAMGTAPFPVASQRAYVERVLAGKTPVASPADPAVTTEQPPIEYPNTSVFGSPQSVKPLSVPLGLPREQVTLRYNPTGMTKTDTRIPGFSVTFMAHEVCIEEDSISIAHGPEIRLLITDAVEDLEVEFNGVKYPVLWIGATFRFRVRDISGINLIRRKPSEPS